MSAKRDDKGKKLDDTEEAVRARLQAILGVDVEQLDDNTTPSTPDLKIAYTDRDPAPVEVTRAIDQDEAKIVNARDFEPWPTTTLTHSWNLSRVFATNTDLKGLRRDAERLLKQLEDAECDGVNPHTEAHWRSLAGLHDPTAEAIYDAIEKLDALGIDQANSYVPQNPPTITVLIGQGGTWDGTANSVPAWTSSFINDQKRADNIRKLDRGGAEAHLAIQVSLDGAGFAVWRGIGDERRDGLIPSSCPVVPITITDVWLSTSFRDGDILHWSRTRGWTRHRP